MKHIATVRCPLAQESVKVFQFSCDWIPDSYLLIEESLSGCYRGINHLRESRNGMYQPIFSSVFRFFQEQINPETLEFDDKKLNETDNIFVSIEFYPTAIEHSPEHPEHPMYTISFDWEVCLYFGLQKIKSINGFKNLNECLDYIKQDAKDYEQFIVHCLEQ